ncbi:MAG TPA: TolC family protein [Vicinamibacterales bacterium]|jgi:outer membrane protein TolC
MTPRFRRAGARLVLIGIAATGGAARAAAQNQPPGLTLAQPEAPSGPPVVLTLHDALERARQLDVQVQSAATDADVAKGDSVQAKSGLLPTFSYSLQYLGNQANGVNPNGRFVSLDGVNMYRSWAMMRQELSANTFTSSPLRRARAMEASAQARLEVAQRGLAVTVTRSYYALVVAERKYATAQQAAQQSARFLEIAQQQERLGQVARYDVVKAAVQDGQQQQNYREAFVAMDNARLSLAVLLFPTFSENFTVVDDLHTAPPLPSFVDARNMASRDNPELRAANETLNAASHDVRSAKNAFYPTLLIDAVYGIEANEFALHSPIAAQPELGVLPNLGYFVTANLTVPIWDWGGLRSKVRQSESREQLARVTLSQTQRQLLSNLYALYNQAVVARAAVDNLQRVADMAAEGLRLTNLRYQAGESTALEVVDAQNTLVQARNAADDAVARYRVALADLQTLTGSFE